MKFSTPISTLAMIGAFLATTFVLTACSPNSQFSAYEAAESSAGVTPDPLPLPVEPKPTADKATEILSGYQHLDPEHLVPTKLLKKAVIYYDQNKAKFPNHDYIAVCDFSANSGKKRFFVIDLKSGAVAAYAVAHGKGSDPDNDGWATYFSNAPQSGASSVGYYRTRSLEGSASHGTIVRIDGLSTTNSNALSRAVILHGAWYTEPEVIKQYGHALRSQGCFAFADSEKMAVLNKIKGGALIYADVSK